MPSGASTGAHEALELRDGDKQRYRGAGVLKAVDNVRGALAKAATGLDAREQQKVDAALLAADGDPLKKKLGANAILAVSMATARAAAVAEGVPLYRWLGGKDANLLPVPYMNVLNGGQHAVGGVDFQEFMLAPTGLPTFREALRAGSECYHVLKEILHDKGLSVNVGDEGGFAPALRRNEDAPELLVQAIEKAGYRPGEDIVLALDPATTELYASGTYDLARTTGEKKSSDEMIALWSDWCAKYSDRLDRGRPRRGRLGRLGEAHARRSARRSCWSATTCSSRRRRASSAASRGTSRTRSSSSSTRSARSARRSRPWTSRRRRATRAWSRTAPGETEDVFIADLAVATGAGKIKTGAPARSERVAKYNQLLRIEEELGAAARYAGKS